MAKVKTVTTEKKVKKSQVKDKAHVVELIETETVSNDSDNQIVEFKPNKEKQVLLKTFLSKQDEIIKILPIVNDTKGRINKIIDDKQMHKMITSPHTMVISNLTNLVKLDPDSVYKSEEERYQEHMELLKANLEDLTPDREDKYVKIPKSLPNLTDFIVHSNVIEEYLPKEFFRYNVRKVLILTDTDYQQTTKTYYRLIRVLRENGIPFIEYTNIQPNITKDLVWNVAAFGQEHEIDSILAFGSWSLIDFSKILAIKLARPDLKHLNQSSSSIYVKSQYHVFSIPTIVCMEDGINARSILLDKDIYQEKKVDKVNLSLDKSIALLTPADNSDCSFFFPEILMDLSHGKLQEAIIETFFRTIQNFFDEKIIPEVEDVLIKDARYLIEILKYLQNHKTITTNQADELALVIVRNVDGTSYLADTAEWTWFLLESALSAEVNAKRSDGLALFAPYYFQTEALEKPKFNARALVLAKKLFDRESVYGLVLELIRFNSEFGLPNSYFGVSEITHVNDVVLANILRKTNYFTATTKVNKKIVESIPLY